MATATLQTNWTQFTKDLKGIPSTVELNKIAKAATASQVARVEKAIDQPLPPRFKKFLLNTSAGIDLRWSLKDDDTVKLKGEREPIASGEMSFHVDKLLTENPQFNKNFKPDPYDVEYRPGKLLAFMSTPNGDQFAVVLAGKEIDRIKYLSHDIDDIHYYTAGKDVVSFLTGYARLGFAGPEYWVWEQFTNKRKTPIDSSSLKAKEFLKAIQKGVKSSSESEGIYGSGNSPARLFAFKNIVLPQAERILAMKDYDLFLAELSPYTDLLEGKIKSKYEELLKKKR